MLSGWLGRRRVPAELGRLLQPDERILAVARLTDGSRLTVSRYGLWRLAAGVAERTGWETMSKATLRGTTLTLVIADPMETWPDGTAVLIDRPPVNYELAAPSGLTDVVHARVRRSVAASRRLDWPGAGGWVVLRRVPGIDGLTVQVRLDPGADPHASGFAGAVAATAAALADGDTAVAG